MNDEIFESIINDIEKNNYSIALLKVNDCLKHNPNDFDAIEMKVNILCYDKKYNQAHNLCDELLKQDANNIKFLELKANVYFMQGQYNYCTSVCKMILETDSENKEAIRLLNEVKPAQRKVEIKSKYNYLKKRLIIAFIIFLAVASCFYFCPTQEVMRCNSDYSCTVEQEFASFIKIRKKIQLSPNSIISFKNYYKPGGRSCRGSYRQYLYFDEKAPFIKYFSSQSYETDIMEDYYSIEKHFYKYLKNPKRRFVVSSEANGIMCYASLILILILAIIIFK